MAKRVLPPRDYLLQLFEYDPKTGLLIWKVRPASHFTGKGRPSHVIAKIFNTQFAGAMALHTPNGDGYRVGAIDQKMYLAHRVIWKMVHGTEPDEIDHINHDRSDNRIANLRAATAQINRKNTSRRRDNKSGVTGIYRHSQNGNWVAQININGKRIHLGSFDSVEAARVARIKAASALDYHANHGKPPT